jgi:NADP-reducing hydrogenase subunit HndB
VPKLTREGLEQLREEVRSRTRLGQAGRRAKLTVHLGTCGIASGAGKVLEAARLALKADGLDDVVLTTSGCPSSTPTSTRSRFVRSSRRTSAEEWS